MLSWFRRKPGSVPEEPPADEPDPGACVKARVALSRDGKSWTEDIDVIATLARVLGEQGHGVISHDTWLDYPETGLVIRPQLHQVVPLEDGGFRTVTTIGISHPELVPQGVFEYQHGWGDSVEGSIHTGFDQWARTDLVALLDALKPRPESCMMLEMSFPEREGQPARLRRAILGPVAHFAAKPPPPIPRLARPIAAPAETRAMNIHSAPVACSRDPSRPSRTSSRPMPFTASVTTRRVTPTGPPRRIASSTDRIGNREHRPCGNTSRPGPKPGSNSASNT
jgi:hypothetical protein